MHRVPEVAIPERRPPGSVVLREVDVRALDPTRLEPVIGPQRMAAFEEAATVARELLDGRAVINVNSTAAGGGVAEMLQTLLAYTRGIGIDTRWVVIEGDPRFFEITKRIHNHLYGAPGDGGPLGAAERAHFESMLRVNGEELRSLVKPGDVVLLHDPQTAALASAQRESGAKVVWRCHVGRDTPNEHTQRGWAFLRPYLEDVDAYVFSRRTFAPDWADPVRVHVIPPSIDPFSTKNQALHDEATRCDPAVHRARRRHLRPHAGALPATGRLAGTGRSPRRHPADGAAASTGSTVSGTALAVGPDEGHAGRDARVRRARRSFARMRISPSLVPPCTALPMTPRLRRFFKSASRPGARCRTRLARACTWPAYPCTTPTRRQ